MLASEDRQCSREANTQTFLMSNTTNTSLNHTTGLFQADELEAMKSLNYDLLDKYWKTGYTMQHSVNIRS